MFISLFFKYFFRRKKRFVVFFFGLFITLLIGHSTVIIVNNINRYYKEINEQFKLDDFALISKNSFFNDTHLDLIKNIDGVTAVEKMLSLSSFYMDIPIKIYGIVKEPKLDVIPHFNWSEWGGNVAIVDSSFANAVNITVGDTINILNESFQVIKKVSLPWLVSYEFNFIGGIIIPFQTFQRILNTSSFNILLVKLRNRGDIPSVIYDIKKSIKIDFNVEIRVNSLELIMESILPLINIANLLVIIMTVVLISTFVTLNLLNIIKDIGVLIALGSKKTDLILSLIMTISIIMLLSSILALATSIKIVELFWQATITYKEVAIAIPIYTILINNLIYIGSASITLLFISIRLFNFQLARIIRKGYLTEKTVKIRRGNVYLKIAFIKILQKRWKTILVLISLMTAISFPTAFENIVYNVPTSAEKGFDSVFKADLILVFYGYINYSIIDRIGKYIDAYESIIYFNLPIYNLSTCKKSVVPPRNYLLVFALQGNETLFTPPIYGKLQPERIGITKKISAVLGIGVGDTIGIRTIHPALKTLLTIQFVVSAIVDINWWGGWAIFFDFNYLKEKLGVQKNAVLIKTKNEEKLINELNKLSFNGFIVSKRNVISAIKSLYEHKVYPFIYFLDFLITNGSMLGILVLIIYEVSFSKREILILKAIGGNRVQTSLYFIIEYVIIIILSIILSLLITPLLISIIIKMINYSLLPIWISVNFDPMYILLNMFKFFLIPIVIYLIVHSAYRSITPKEFSE